MLIQKNNIIPAMGLFSLSMACIIIVRLLNLQILHHDYYSEQSVHNYTRYESICSTRGEILDCNGHKLATNRPRISIYWQGTGNRTLHASQHELLTLIQQHISTFALNDACLQRIRKAERTNERILLCTDIDPIALSCIAEQCGADKNIHIHHEVQRHYPFKEAASHIIGYVRGGYKQQLGTMGLEKYLEDMLQGTGGIRIKTVNSYGKKIHTSKPKASTQGNSIQTTLDITLQLLAEKIFAHPHEGTLILMNPIDGAIKALVSLPNFDPSLFLAPIDSQTWHMLQNKKPFSNKALQCTYPPGSLFKLITVSAGLEEHLIQPNNSFTCEGSWKFGNRLYRCHNRRGHGTISVMQGLARSCNILFYQLGAQLSIDTLTDYAMRFGLGLPTGILFPEKIGLMPTAAWKKETKGEPWWQGETVSAAIGQSYMSVTPLQIARMIGSIFTGYLVKPRIHLDETVEKTPLTIKPETLEFLRSSMRSVVTEGTGKQMHTVKEITLFAKTSTAQVVALKPNNKTKEHREHGWLVAYFTCKNKDPLVLVVLVEHAGSSRVPLMITKEFLLEYCKL